MSKKKRKKVKEKRAAGSLAYFLSTDAYEDLCASGYTPLSHNPEILTACRKIADLISSMTIHLMANTDQGDQRIVNELSRKIDITPNRYMTRKSYMDAVVMNLLLYGNGNSVVMIHTKNGNLEDFEPVAAGRVGFQPEGYGYRVLIDGTGYDPEEVLHFTLNPDETYPWKGKGFTAALKDIAENLKQARKTEKGFMESKWKPSIIVKVDALTEEFSGPAGRQKLLESYVGSSRVGDPWLIPSEQFDVKEIRPLSLADLAINDTVQLDKRTVAAIIGVPPFVLGVGEYNQKEWNSFVNTKIMSIAKEIEQEMTRKVILSPKWYLKFNILSLMDWDIGTVANVFGGLSDRGIITGNEVRDRIGLSPKEGLDELKVLENFIPMDRIGDQKKLIEEKEEQ